MNYINETTYDLGNSVSLLNMDDLAVGCALFSVDGHALAINRQGAKILNCSKEDFFSVHPFSELIIRMHLRADNRDLHDLLEGRIPSISTETPIQIMNDKTIWIESKISLKRKFDPTGALFVVIFDDITLRKDTEIHWQTKASAAQSASREKSHFLANMSHEIRSPLGIMLGFADLLAEESVSEHDRANYVSVLRQNGKDLARLINEILDLSKVESGHLEIHYEDLNLNSLIDEVITLFKLPCKEKGLELSFIAESSLPAKISLDPVRLKQILVNMVGNAVKFTKHGSVIISAEFQKSRNDSPPLLVLRVTDTGPGISQKDADRLFNPFTQANKSTARKYGGTGLGLALSRRFAQAMKGELILKSSVPEVGSVFELALPVLNFDFIENSPEWREQICGLRSTPQHSLEGVRVLIADDSADNQVLIERMLKKQGASVDFASDGYEAVEKTLGKNYDIVLMDMQMPAKDGYEATRQLRSSGYRKPIVALTASAMREDREKCIAAGCSEYSTKPIDSAELSRIIQELLSPKPEESRPVDL